MLYLDPSALIKRYLRERGTAAMNARFASGKRSGERLFTSALTYAEVHAVLGRKWQNNEISNDIHGRAQEQFTSDWLFSLTILEVDTRVMADLRALVNRYPLRGADAVHLSAVHWLRDMCWMVSSFAAGDHKLEFAVSDHRLAGFARDDGFEVFDPELVETDEGQE